jgi:undecaprenyl-diphosphatase
MTFLQSLILAIVEGLTEYLPISSTGHLILSSWTMGINQDPFVKDYTVMVQFGAIFAVVILYWRRFILNTKLYPQVVIGVIPAVVIGLALKKRIDVLLGNVWVVAIALLVGGVLLILTDKWVLTKNAVHPSLEKLPKPSAFKIGLFQCLAFIPGVSRSAASIWGGIHQGLTLEAATEFSFFLAVPTLTGATLLKLLKVWPTLDHDQIQAIVYGNIISFFIGALAIKAFVGLVKNYGLRYFGYYRVILGLIVIAVLLSGHDVQVL